MTKLIPLKYRVRTFFRKFFSFFALKSVNSLFVSIFLTFNFFSGVFTGVIGLASKSGSELFSLEREPGVFWFVLFICAVGFLFLIGTAYAWAHDQELRKGRP
ncbi:MAG: hypothetical protein Q8J65_05265 [Nitrosomonadales bacterium]|nr:hypothetical protein [Nitrosomonadales bacterium]